MMKGSFCRPQSPSSPLVTKLPVPPPFLPSPFLPPSSPASSHPTLLRFPPVPLQVPKPWLGAGPELNSETLSSWISDLQVGEIYRSEVDDLQVRSISGIDNLLMISKSEVFLAPETQS